MATPLTPDSEMFEPRVNCSPFTIVGGALLLAAALALGVGDVRAAAATATGARIAKSGSVSSVSVTLPGENTASSNVALDGLVNLTSRSPAPTDGPVTVSVSGCVKLPTNGLPFVS